MEGVQDKRKETKGTKETKETKERQIFLGAVGLFGALGALAVVGFSSMQRLRVLLGILIGLVLLQAAALAFLALIVYQATPKAILANDTLIGRIPGVLVSTRIIDRMMNPFYWGPKAPEPLPHYTISLDPDGLEKLQESLPTDRPSPYYANLFLTEDGKEWIDGTLSTDDGETYDIEARVRGDIFNHWAYRKKSWRIRIKDGKFLNGMSEINLILPEDRDWFAEHMTGYRAETFGLLYPQIRTVTITLNGSGPLLYTEIEHWTAEMFEKQGKSGEANVYKTGGGRSYYQQWDPVFDDIAYWEKYLTDPQGDTYEQVDRLLQLAMPGAHNDPQYEAKLRSLVDIDQLTKWYVLGLLAGSRHVSEFNMRLYFDPDNGLFEPLPWDIGLYSPRPLLFPSENALLEEILHVPAIKLAAYRMAWDYVQDDDQVQRDIDRAAELRAMVERAAYRDPLKLFSNRQVRGQLNDQTNKIARNLSFLKDELSRSEVLVTQRIPASTEDGVLAMFDITARGVAPPMLSGAVLPMELKTLADKGAIMLASDDGNGVLDDADVRIALTVDSEPDDDGGVLLHTANNDALVLLPGDPVRDASDQLVPSHKRYRFFLISSTPTKLPDGAFPLELRIRNALTGKKIDPIGEVVVDERTFARLPEAMSTRQEFLAQYPFFQARGDDDVVLRGNHQITETVIVPQGVRLVIEPGTTVRMGSGTSFISYSPVSITGLPTALVRFGPLNAKQTWGVFAVIHADGASNIEWAEFDGGNEATINGVHVTGMVAFHDSPVAFDNVVFRNAHGASALNTKAVHIEAQHLLFEKNMFDGFAIDAPPAGTLETSIFRANGRDSIALSLAPIIIRNIEVYDSGDACIRASEGSAPLIYDVTLAGCRAGIAVRDDAHAKVERAKFERNDIAIRGYGVKPFFGPASASVNESTFTQNKAQMQAGSGAVITIDGAE